MKTNPTQASLLLRQKAEEIFKHSLASSGSVLSEAETTKLIHELEVHKVELEMQNEELQLAKQQSADLATEKYAQLYDFAPTAYYTLNRLGEITLLNHRGAAILGMGRALLVNQLFRNFVTEDTKPAFNHLLGKVFESAEKETCEVTLKGLNTNPTYVLLQAIASQEEECLVAAVDITDRRKSEESLIQSERFLKQSQEIAKLGSYTIDFATNSWFGSETLYSVLGIEPGFVKTFDGWVSIIHPEWQQVMRDYFTQEVLLKKNKFDKEYKIIRPDDKRERWVHGIGQLELNNQNQQVKLIGIIRDITESKLAEEKIRISHSRLRTYIDSNIVGVIIADTSGKILETNDYYLNIIGYSRSDFESGIVDWRKITPPEWLPADEKAISEIQETGRCTPYEKQYVRKDGSLCYVLITDALLPGPEMQIAGYIVDITERKNTETALLESELKYRELIENSPDAIVIYSKGNIVFVNKECLRLMNVASNVELLGKPVLQFVHPDFRESVEQRMKEFEGKGIVLPVMEERFIRPDGTEVDVDVKAMPQKFENKQAVQLIIRDITQRKLDEKKLNESRERLNKSQAMGHLGSWELDLESETLIWSDEVYRIFGLHPQEFGATHEAFLESVHPDDRDTLNKAYFSSVEEGKNGYELEHRVIRRHTGEVRFVYEKCEHIRDISGKIIRSVGMVHDITERRQAEEALRASESLYRAILEASPDDVTVADSEGRALMISPSALKMFGYETEEKLIGRKVTDFFVPADKVRAAEHVSLMMQGIKTGPNQYSGVRADGSTFNFEVNGAVIPGTGGIPAKMIFVGRDITERSKAEDELKASELKFRELFEANSDGITIFNMSPEGPPSNIIDLNENSAKMVGYTREEMKLLTPNEFEKDITPEKMEKRMNDLLTKGFSDFETIIIHKDGHEIKVEIKVVMINYHNQPALMNIVRDITERKKTELQLQKYAIELSRQIAEKDKFFFIIAHDLRGPFNGFLELTELMADGSSNMSMEDIKKIAGAMKKSATNLFRLLGNLLEWSRMQRGITTFNPKYLGLKSRMLEITSLAYEASVKKGIEIDCDFPDDLVVFADENMLEGIIRNLTANAVKYTNTGGKITVSAKSLPDDAVEFAVKDTGIGMSKDMVDNLFNIDVNTNRKGTSGELSTGLGLLICKDFIEKHNSTLCIESEPRVGSKFFFTIPGHIETGEKPVKTISGSPAVPSNESRKLKILIAEDEETSDLLISIALSKISREFFHAKTGKEAIDILHSHADIDLIMMDIQMPEMDGYEATRLIRQFNTDVVIIAQTAYTFSNEREKAIKAGCNDYISKPISQAELLELVWKYIK